MYTLRALLFHIIMQSSRILPAVLKVILLPSAQIKTISLRTNPWNRVLIDKLRKRLDQKFIIEFTSVRHWILFCCRLNNRKYSLDIYNTFNITVVLSSTPGRFSD